MSQMTLQEIQEGLALSIEADDAEGIQLFTDAYSMQKQDKNKRSPKESFDRQLGLAARYLAEPYEMLYNPVSAGLGKLGITDGRTLEQAFPNIYSVEPETKMEKAVSYPSRALSYTMMPLNIQQGAKLATMGVKTPPSLLSQAPKTKVGEMLQATKQGFKKGFLENPKAQAAAATTFGIGASAATALDTDLTNMIPEPVKEIGGGIISTLLKKPTQNLIKDTYGNIKSAVTQDSPKIINKTNDIINKSLSTSNITLDELPTNVQYKLKSIINDAVKKDKNLSEQAIKRLISYELSGATPTVSRLNPNSSAASRESEKAMTDQNLFDTAANNQTQLIMTLDEMGAGLSKNSEEYGTDLAKTLEKEIQQTQNQFNNRYNRIANTKEGRNVLFDHVYFTNKVADRLAKTFKQFSVPPETQKLVNSFALGVNKLSLSNREQLKSRLSENIASSSGGERAAYKEIRNVLDETPLMKNQRFIETEAGKNLRTELDSVRNDYKQFMQSLEKDSIRSYVYKGNEIKPNFFTTTVLNKTPLELRKFYNTLTKTEQINFKNNYLGDIKNKIVSGDSINTNVLDKILNNPKKLEVVFSKNEILRLKAIRDTAKYEKNIKTKLKSKRAFFEPPGKLKSISKRVGQAFSETENFYNIEKGLLSEPTKGAPLSIMGVTSLLGE
tara:strand:+ start:1438 stop:3444 length:2007 start_codon:yes stop_codon:yes gene_type:complete